ncbi:MAG: hypothetical protein AAFR04_08525 [Pseudomonadota bacterium]
MTRTSTCAVPPVPLARPRARLVASSATAGACLVAALTISFTTLSVGLNAPVHAAGYVHRAIVRVNDQPITQLQVNARMKLMMLGNREVVTRMRSALRSKSIGKRFRAYAIARKPRSQADVERLKKQFVAGIRRRIERQVLPTMRKRALDELINERLQIQAARRRNIVIGKTELDRVLTTVAKRNKMTLPQFAKHLRKLGTHISTMRSRMKASLAWSKLIRGRFSRLVDVSQRDIDDLIATENSGASTGAAQIKLQRITLKIPGQVSPQRLTARMAEGERLRQRFRDCKTMPALAKRIANASYENLGTRGANTLSEPSRSIVLSTADQQMTPPVLSGRGVELYAVCGRSKLKGTPKMREAARRKVRQKRFALHARRHLQNLRQAAYIQYLR